MCVFYQLLPFIEETAASKIVNAADLDQITITLYNCPSRRGVIRNAAGISLIDYAGALAGPSRSELGDAEFNSRLDMPQTPLTRSKQSMWGCTIAFCTESLPNALQITQAKSSQPEWNWMQFRGVIQRTDWLVVGDPPTEGRVVGFGTKMTFAKISDGTSKTMLIGEKWLPPEFYDGQTQQVDGNPIPNSGDNEGWADAWDCNNMRSTIFPPRSDSDVSLPNGVTGSTATRLHSIRSMMGADGSCDSVGEMSFGAAHAAGINVAFADGSVQFINYDVDLETFNRLGHRHDGETVGPF